MQASSEYAALKKALAIAGVDSESLETLIKSQLDPDAVSSSDTSPVKPVRPSHGIVASPEKQRWTAEAPIFVPKSVSPPKRQVNGTDYASPLTAPSFNYDKVDPIADHETNTKFANDWYEEEEEEHHVYNTNRQDRTLIIRGLSPFTTLADLAKVIRGGIILNMYIRAKDRTAVVSFVDAVAAEKFIMHSRRSDIYLKGKRLEVTWAEKQSDLTAFIQRQVYRQGATRNIVIRFAKKDMTEEAIREDLEHIHRLEVVDIVTANNHLFISLNGIQWAITARHCMLSRLKYKGTRIEFFEDECDQVLPPIEKKIYKKRQENHKRPATVSMANRFAMLFEDDGVSTDEHEMGKPVNRSVSAGEVKDPA